MLPCNNKYGPKEFDKIKTTHPKQMISFLPRNAVLGSKLYIWKNLVKHYGRKFASKIMPTSYILPNDVKELKDNFKNGKYYVMKSEAQRQKGLKLTKNLDEILKSKELGFKIIQEYINNPMTHDGYKVNFRVYLLVTCDSSNRHHAHVYDDGIISYSKSKYTNISFDSSVSSFYSSKKLYKMGYPLTLKELKSQRPNINWKIIIDDFHKKIILLLDAALPKMCPKELQSCNKGFQLFGVDFIVTKNNESRILEVNIGPGMEPYSKRDELIRKKLHTDMLSVIGVNQKNKNNGFISLF